MKKITGIILSLILVSESSFASGNRNTTIPPSIAAQLGENKVVCTSENPKVKIEISVDQNNVNRDHLKMRTTWTGYTLDSDYYNSKCGGLSVSIDSYDPRQPAENLNTYFYNAVDNCVGGRKGYALEIGNIELSAVVRNVASANASVLIFAGENPTAFANDQSSTSVSCTLKK
jgi:hypothetical protein